MTRLLSSRLLVRRFLGIGILGCVLTILGMFLARTSTADTPARSAFNGDSTVDEVLGNGAHQEFAAALAEKTYGGKKHDWKTFTDWGRQLLTKASVSNPPEGQTPSEPLSKAYRCVHCHNLSREDPKLTTQDPDAREQLMRAKPPENPAKRDGAVVSLTAGTTLWGAVNRESFYNGHYAQYHRLKVANEQPMNPKQLADAVQICCRFCSVGRYPEPWELDSILAALWDLELHVKDLDLPETDMQRILADLQGDQVVKLGQARLALKKAYLTASKAERSELPSRTTIEYDEYAPGQVIKGDAEKGKLLYASACAGCHNREFDLPEGRRLADSAKQFHKYVWHGTERHDDLYMPFFSKQRLSQRQAADIRAYLRSLP
jgi:mono/diheme cytochrome c family protein